MANPLIHVAKIRGQNGRRQYLYLRKSPTHSFDWYEEIQPGVEQKTAISAENIEEAIRLANRAWKEHEITSLICGFRYTLPERDEHGLNALFHQMVASYSSMNGVYYDDELGNNCFVQNASQEARQLWLELKKQQRL